jgi:acid phosphatase type 7
MSLRSRVHAALGISAVSVAVLAAQSGPVDVVLRTASAPVVAGKWTRVADATAAGGSALRHPDESAPKLTTPLAAPANYFELTFEAQAGTAYRLWIRGRADADSWTNDSIYAQFSDSVDASSAAIYRIGTTSATTLTVEDCNGCGVKGWGWQDNGYGTGVLGPPIYFAASGTHTLRIQTREDGLRIDQIVLSPSTYLSTAPGATRNDATILPVSGPTVATLVHGPYLQQASASSMRIVWATLESGQGQVRYVKRPAGTPVLAVAASRLVPKTISGLAFDYVHHEATIDGLAAASGYDYELFLDANPVGSASTYSLRTAPADGTGPVTFIAFGDSGTGSSEQQQLAALMAADDADLVLHTGDMAYGNSAGTGDASWKTFEDWFFAIYRAWLPSRPVFPTEGNHDSRPTNGDGRAYLDLFSLPANGASVSFPDHAERYYSFDYGPVHFVALDTEFAFQDTARRSEQLAWLDADLASTTQPWKVAYFHRSPFSAGGEHGSDLAVRDAFAPLLERHGVPLALSAHEHDYERTLPQSVAGGKAVTYVVSGGGGGPLYAAGTAAWTAFSASRHHYVRASVGDCLLQLEAVGLDGIVFDGATLNRCVEPPPPPPSSDVVLYAVDAVGRAGAWVYVADATAAAGSRLRHPDAGAPKLAAPLASPQHYVDFDFDASAGTPYRLWIRGKADANSWANDSVFVQFSGAVDGAGRPVYRIGTTTAATVTLEDCTGCGVSGWGWQDNGFAGLGPAIVFAAAGPQRIRIQTREDGLSIDQIVLSPERYLTASPGALKKDTVIVPQVQ